MSARSDASAYLDALSARPIVVVGDAILDEYLTGRAGRLSREAPIPVLDFESRRYIPGGAANPAATLAAVGARPRLLSIAGEDAEAAALAAALDAREISHVLVADPARPTPVKTRIMAQMGLRFPQQVARIDRVAHAPVSPAIEAALLAALETAAAGAGALLFSDYGGGAITPALIVAAASTGLLLAADAQGGFERYHGFDLLKCNADEAAAALDRPLHTHADFADAARALFERLALRRMMALTRGGDGMTIATPDGTVHIPAPRVTEVYDTVGAGDTTIAMLTLMLLSGAAPAEAARVANAASGVVVRHVGNYAPTLAEIRAALAENEPPGDAR